MARSRMPSGLLVATDSRRFFTSGSLRVSGRYFSILGESSASEMSDGRWLRATRKRKKILMPMMMSRRLEAARPFFLRSASSR